MRLTFCAAAVMCWQAFKGVRLTEKEGLELNVEADAEQRQLPDHFHAPAFLGAGANGSVFRATDTKHGNIPVAVKVLNKPQTECISECSIVQKLMRACTPPHDQSCLGASHIVRCLEQSDPSSGISWMSTELVEGKDFAYHFANGLPPNWNIQLGQQVIAQFVAALNFMARGGVSHNDLSDHFGNVMVANLDSAPNLHIIDFGRASVGSPVSDGADVLRQGNDEVRLWLWPLMILPSHKNFRDGGACLDPLKFEAHLGTLLFDDDSKPLSQEAVGSGISTDEMEILLLAADDELQPSSLRKLAQMACHAINGNEEPCPFPLGPDVGDIAGNYCYNWPIASADSPWKRIYSKSQKNTWLDDRWEKVCKRLPGGKACDERPAKDVATFVASVWTLMFKMQASLDEYWNACPKCRKRSLNERWKQLCEKSTCAIDETVQDEIERLYKQQAIDNKIDCDAESCTIKKSEEEKVTIELVCTEQCKTYGTKTFGLFNDSIPCCLTPEIPENKEHHLTSEYPGIIKWGPILKAFPDHSQRGKLVKQMWQGLFSADGLSFLQKLIVDEGGVGVLIKEPFVSKVLATEPSTNQAADAYAAYPAKTC